MRSAPFGEADQVSYRGRRIGLPTQHGKERVISPELDRALDCRVERVGGYDTDLLGTFTRDVPRAGTQLEAAGKKARTGMEPSGLPLGLASEARSLRTLTERRPSAQPLTQDIAQPPM